MNIALVNTNRMKPPIAPIGLDYVAEALAAAGHHVEVLDLCWVDDCDAAVRGFFEATRFDLTGVTLRNTDDCSFVNRQSFLEGFAAIVNTIHQRTDSPIVLGGVGYSVMPEAVLASCEADAGIWGDGEFAFVELANRIDGDREWLDLPSLVWRRGDRWHRNPSAFPSLHSLPPMSRRFFDNQRYFCEGGQAGIETKRGCPRSCIYCADPVAKGTTTRVRPPEAVVDELERLLEQGIDHIHTCDSEFNVPEEHAVEICQEIIRRDLCSRLRWYAYCSPVPFSPKLARLMRRAGCVGVNFGADSGDEGMLKRLRCAHTPQDILTATRLSREAGMMVMLDLLLGSPGETKESIVSTIELMRSAGPDRVGICLGVRVYPRTELASLTAQVGLREGLVGGGDLLEPLFFLEPAIAPFALDLLGELIGDDQRFLFFDSSTPDSNYNYNANQRLVDAIHKGYRGAYWDILRRCA